MFLAPSALGRLAAIAALALLWAAPATAKSYAADRFDVHVRVLPGGVLEVSETVVFRFESGTFREVFREIPLRRTDGIEVVDAAMDGRRLPDGAEPGTVEVRRRDNRLRVTWRFTPVQDTTRQFALTYRVRGVVRQDPAGDRLAWRALPGEHAYQIDRSRITFDLPAAAAAAPAVTTRRAERHAVAVDGTRVRIEAEGIRRNGWIEASLQFERGILISTPPAWQQRAARIEAGAPRWIAAAAALVAIGLVLLAGLRQGYDGPPGSARASAREHQPFPPENLEPPIAGALASNGRPALQHAMAALFALGDRGDIEVRATRALLGIRDFELTRTAGGAPLRGYDRAVLRAIFKGDPRPGDTVALSKARSRLTMKFRDVRDAIREELEAAGLLDRHRAALRRRYNRVAVGLAIVGGVAFAPAAFLTGEHGGWPLLLPAALLIVSLAAALFAEAITPLSNDGVRRSARWRAYRRHLQDVARGEQPSFGGAPDGLLTLAVALGLAPAWAKYLKRQGAPVPGWFQAAQPGDAYAAFPAFVAAGGGGGGSAGGGGGAAGGGASGAG